MAILVEYKMLDGRLHCYASDNEKPLFCDFVDLDISNAQCHDWLLLAFDDFDGGYSKSYRLQKTLVFYTAEAYRVVSKLFDQYSKEVSQ